MYRTVRYCIYDPIKGLYYQGSQQWTKDFPKCKVYSGTGPAKNAIHSMSPYDTIKDELSIYTVSVELGDKL